MVRILHITPTYRPTIGGIESVVENLVKQLSHMGYVADVAHLSVGAQRRVDHLDGITVFRLPIYGNRLVGLAPGLAAIAKNYDLLHVHDPQLTAISLSVMACGAGMPAVLSTHGGFWHTQQYRLWKGLYEKLAIRRILRCYGNVLATSCNDLAYFQQYTDRITLAENGVDVGRFRNLAAAGPRDPHNWIYWGRLSRNKRLDIAVDYVFRLRNAGVPVTLTIAGRDFDGLGQTLKAEIARLGLADSVSLCAAPDNDTLLDMIGRAGLFFTASEHEGFGLSIVEAMAAGLAVFCRDIAPMNGFFSGAGNNLLLKFEDAEHDLAEMTAFFTTWNDGGVRRYSENPATAERYAWSNVVQRYIDGYRAALGHSADMCAAT